MSRSPLPYLRRCGLVPAAIPGQIFSPELLRVNRYDTGPSVRKSVLAEGAPPPDRARAKPWAPAREEPRP